MKFPFQFLDLNSYNKSSILLFLPKIMKTLIIIALTVLVLPIAGEAQQTIPFRDLTVGNRFVYFARPRYYEPEKPRPSDTTYRYFEQVMSDTLIIPFRVIKPYFSQQDS